MFDVDALARHEAELLREEAARIADTETALQSVLDGVVLVPLVTHRQAPHRRVSRQPVSVRRRMALLVGASAAVVAIALVATRDDDAKPADQPSPTVTVPPTVTVRPRALLGTPPYPARLFDGTYFFDWFDVSTTPRIFVTVDDGWSRESDESPILSTVGNSMVVGAEGWLMFSRPDAVYSDACHPLSEGLYPGPVTTLDGLVAALSVQQGWAEVTDPTDISIDGYVGKAFQRTTPTDMSACDTTNATTRWSDTDQRTPNPYFASWIGEREGLELYERGEIETLWVLDIDGTVVVINARSIPTASASARADLAAALDSIRIEGA